MKASELRVAILERDDLPRFEIEIPEWDGELVHVRAMTAGEVEEFGRKVSEHSNGNGGGGFFSVLASLAVKVLVDEVGDRIFGDDDAEALAGKHHKALQRVFDAAQEISGLNDDIAGN